MLWWGEGRGGEREHLINMVTMRKTPNFQCSFIYLANLFMLKISSLIRKDALLMYNSCGYLKIFMYSLIKQSFVECESSIMLGRRYSKMEMAWFLFPVRGLQANLNRNPFPHCSAWWTSGKWSTARTPSLGMCVDGYLQNVFSLFKSQHFCAFLAKLPREKM